MINAKVIYWRGSEHNIAIVDCLVSDELLDELCDKDEQSKMVILYVKDNNRLFVRNNNILEIEEY